MIGYKVPANPYKPSDYQRAVDDTATSHKVTPRVDGTRPRCVVLVKAEGSSVYGIRPCLRLITFNGKKWEHK